MGAALEPKDAYTSDVVKRLRCRFGQDFELSFNDLETFSMGGFVRLGSNPILVGIGIPSRPGGDQGWPDVNDSML